AGNGLPGCRAAPGSASRRALHRGGDSFRLLPYCRSLPRLLPRWAAPPDDRAVFPEYGYSAAAPPQAGRPPDAAPPDGASARYSRGRWTAPTPAPSECFDLRTSNSSHGWCIYVFGRQVLPRFGYI